VGQTFCRLSVAYHLRVPKLHLGTSLRAKFPFSRLARQPPYSPPSPRWMACQRAGAALLPADTPAWEIEFPSQGRSQMEFGNESALDGEPALQQGSILPRISAWRASDWSSSMHGAAHRANDSASCSHWAAHRANNSASRSYCPVHRANNSRNLPPKRGSEERVGAYYRHHSATQIGKQASNSLPGSDSRFGGGVMMKG